MLNYRVFETPESVVKSLAETLSEYSFQDKPIHISLSGGSTPKLLYKLLAQMPFCSSINWSNLHFWWGDERCVPPEDPESNFGEAKVLLFDHVLIPGDNIHRILGEWEPVKAANRFENEMKLLIPTKNGLPCFDWVLLGMGDDGHTASLFPGKTDYAERNLAIVAQHPDSGQYRVSKSAHLLANAERISYLVLGENKADVIRDIHEQSPKSDIYPAAQVKSVSGITEWLLDKGAAKLIP